MNQAEIIDLVVSSSPPKLSSSSSPIFILENSPSKKVRPSSDVITTTRIIFTCDVCGKSPLESIRYRCQSCEEFDVCQDCFSNAEHQHHTLLPQVIEPFDATLHLVAPHMLLQRMNAIPSQHDGIEVSSFPVHSSSSSFEPVSVPLLLTEREKETEEARTLLEWASAKSDESQELCRIVALLKQQIEDAHARIDVLAALLKERVALPLLRGVDRLSRS